MVRGRLARGQAGEPSFAASPGEWGGKDIFGGDDVVPGWPKPIASLVNDRGDDRVWVFDENGQYLSEWSFGPQFRPRSGANPAMLVSRPVYTAWNYSERHLT
jgi:hypothetical protein